MNKITLPFLKQRQICNTDPIFYANVVNNIKVSRYRMDSGDSTYIRWEIEDMVYEGNNPMSNEDILDMASICATNNIYTEEEWNKYFLPAINRQLKANNSFVRRMPGDLIQCIKKDGYDVKVGETAIVEYDYAAVYGGRNFRSLRVCSLDKKGNIKRSWAWADYDKWKLADNKHRSENIIKMWEYRKKHARTESH